MSDSDSEDDLLLQGPSFMKPRARTEENKKRKHLALIDDALKESNRKTETMTTIVRLQRETESIDDSDLKARAIELSSTNHASAVKLRLETEDAIEGMLSPSRNDGILSRQAQVELQAALDTELSVCWGTRDIIFFNYLEASKAGIVFDKDRATDAADQLLNICRQIRSACPNGDCRYNEVLACMTNAVEARCIPHFLRENRLSKLLNKNNIILHNMLREWLIAAVYSTDLNRANKHLGDAACFTLRKLRKKGKTKEDTTQQTLEHFLKLLRLWVRVGESNEGIINAKARSKNVGGLSNCLKIWEQEFQYCDISMLESDTIINTISTINLMMLDSSVISNSVCHDLKNDIMNIMAVLIESLCAQSNTEKGQFVNKLKLISKTSFGRLKELLDREKSSDSQIDPNIWQLYTALVRSIPENRSTTSLLSQPLCQLKIYMALHSLSLCLSIECCEEAVSNMLKQREYSFQWANFDSPETFISIASAIVGFIYFEEKHDSLKNDPSLCLAIIENSYLAYYAGLNLLTTSQSAVTSDLCSITQAGQYLPVLETFEKQTCTVSKICTKYANQSHFRRADFLLRVLQQYNNFVIGRLSRVVGSSENSPLAQNTIKHYFTPSIGKSEQ